MDRRSFIRGIIAAGASCAILPSALTYARKWKWISIGGPVRETCEFTWRCIDQPLEWVGIKTFKDLREWQYRVVGVPRELVGQSCSIENGVYHTVINGEWVAPHYPRPLIQA